MYLRCSHRLCLLFPMFFFVALLPLSYRQGKFRISSAIRFSGSSSFKLNLVDLNVLPDLNLRLAKLSLLQQSVYQNLHVAAVTLFLSYVAKFENYGTLFFVHFQRIDVKSNRCFSGLPLISIILYSPALFQNLKKSVLLLEKKCPN